MELDTQSFPTAKENMDYDQQLATKLIASGEPSRFFRFYTWQQPGLTQSEKRNIPNDLLELDHGYRLTGGGLVFHCPGDLVFSLGVPVDDTVFPKSIKARCSWVSELISNSLNAVGIPATLLNESPTRQTNIQFCMSYPNPYECYVEDQKILGIAVKRSKEYTVFQGVVHLQDTATYFSDYAQYQQYFTGGCRDYGDLSSDTIIQSLQKELSLAFESI